MRSVNSTYGTVPLDRPLEEGRVCDVKVQRCFRDIAFGFWSSLCLAGVVVTFTADKNKAVAYSLGVLFLAVLAGGCFHRALVSKSGDGREELLDVEQGRELSEGQAK